VKDQDGFTLIEMLVTMVVAIVLVSLGVPAFKSITANSRAAGQVNTLVTALNLARGEAVTRSVPVTICKLNVNGDPTVVACEDTASETDWSTGWLVFDDPNQDGVLDDPAAELIRVWGAPSGNPAILAVDGDDNGLTFLRFDPLGAKTPQILATLTITNPDCTGNQVRVVSVSVTGQITNTRAACPE
jgi:type IV fimbrial biogenesis protein FimT